MDKIYIYIEKEKKNERRFAMYRGHKMFKGFLLLATMAFSWFSVAAVPATAADEYHHLSAAYGRDGVTPAFIVPLFPQK